MRNACIALLGFLSRLTVAASSGAALTVVLYAFIQHFFPDPTERPRGSLANLEMRQDLAKPPQDRAGRPIPPLADISDSSAQTNAGIRWNGQASEERREPVSTGLRRKTAREEEQALPSSAAADRTPAPQDHELSGVAPTKEQQPKFRATTLQNSREELSAITMAVAADTPPDRKAIELAEPGSSSPAITAHPRADGLSEQQPVPPIGLHISIHYRRDSSAARMDAQRVASWLVSSSFGTPRLLTTEHPVAAPVIRYFFSQDAAGAALVVRTLGSRDQSWRVEDCRSWRRKPPAGTIEVWPHA
jgi:hypothetical protein